MTFRVMAGITAIWAGNVRTLKDGSVVMSGKKYNVTDDVLAAAAIWLTDNDARSIVIGDGRKITLKVEVKEEEE